MLSSIKRTVFSNEGIDIVFVHKQAIVRALPFSLGVPVFSVLVHSLSPVALMLLLASYIQE